MRTMLIPPANITFTEFDRPAYIPFISISVDVNSSRRRVEEMASMFCCNNLYVHLKYIIIFNKLQKYY